MATPTLSRPHTIIHPARLRILMALHGRERTPQEIGRALGDLPQASLYRHIALLIDAGLVEVAGERREGARAERVLRLKGRLLEYSDAEVDALTREDLIQFFQTWLGALVEASDRYFTQETVRVREDGVSFFLASAYLTDDEAIALRRETIARYESLDAGPGPGRRRRTLGFASLPDPEEETHD